MKDITLLSPPFCFPHFHSNSQYHITSLLQPQTLPQWLAFRLQVILTSIQVHPCGPNCQQCSVNNLYLSSQHSNHRQRMEKQTPTQTLYLSSNQSCFSQVSPSYSIFLPYGHSLTTLFLLLVFHKKQVANPSLFKY